jgi:predicted peptidase
MRKTVPAYCWFLFVNLLVSNTASAIDISDFVDFSLRSGGSTLLPGRMYIPPEAIGSSATPRPFIVFLHGGGGAGTDNMRQLNKDIGDLALEAERRGAFLFVPQAPLNWRPKFITDYVMTMVDHALLDYEADPTRLYLSGYSSGGGGTWNMLSRYPNRFAAAVSVSPVSAEPDFLPANLIGQPIAVFHARNDSIASVTTTRDIINRILIADNRAVPTYPSATAPDFTYSVADLDLNYIEPASGGHSVLRSVYNKPQLYSWLFAHSTAPEPSTGVLLLTGALFFLGHRRRDRLPRRHGRTEAGCACRILPAATGTADWKVKV